MPQKIRKLSSTQEKVIKRISDYIDERQSALKTHYLSVKTKNGQNKNNDIYECESRVKEG